MLKKLSMFCICIIMTVLCGTVCFGSIIITKDKGGQDTLNMPDTNSEGVLVVDTATGYTIYEKNIYKSLYPASTTKIMTAMLVLDNAKLDETVTFSHDAVFSIEKGSSAAFVDEGECLSVEQCLYGLMVISANDLANGLAEHVSGSIDKFALLMNEKAKELGCVDTHFTNPHGLYDDNHYTCVYDLGIMSLNAYINYDLYRLLIATELYEVPPTNKQEEIRYWANTNKLLNEYEKFYYPECVGGKPGYTSESGASLVSYAKINGRYIMIVTLGAQNATSVYTDHTNIYDYIKENVSEEYFTELEQIYEANKGKFDENADDTGNNDAEDVISNNVVDKNASEQKSTSIFTIILRIIGAIFFVLIILYTILRIRLEIRRRRRRKRMLKKRRRQRRLRGDLLIDMNRKDKE